jgi:transcriptional regulator with XRE-family HTH domain
MTIGTLNKYVYLIRLHKDMSQEDLAQAMGFSRTRIADIERGKNSPTGDTITRIAAAMGMTDNQFYKLGAELSEQDQ